MNENAECAICFNKELNSILLKCKHIFCNSCIQTWYTRSQTCPMCRAAIHLDDLRPSKPIETPKPKKIICAIKPGRNLIQKTQGSKQAIVSRQDQHNIFEPDILMAFNTRNEHKLRRLATGWD